MKYYVIALISLVLMGCEEKRMNYPTTTDNIVIEKLFWPSHAAYMIKFSDGTKCVATTGGGVDCNWKRESSQDE